MAGFIINSINTMLWAWSFSNISYELFKRCVEKFYSSAAIPMEVFNCLQCTSVFCMKICLILFRPFPIISFSALYPTFNRGLYFFTSTRNTSFEAIEGNCFYKPAYAQASYCPSFFFTVIRFGQSSPISVLVSCFNWRSSSYTKCFSMFNLKATTRICFFCIKRFCLNFLCFTTLAQAKYNSPFSASTRYYWGRFFYYSKFSIFTAWNSVFHIDSSSQKVSRKCLATMTNRFRVPPSQTMVIIT